MFHFGFSGEMLLDYLVLTTFIAIWFRTLTLIPAIFPIAIHMNSSPSYSCISSGTSWICESRLGTLRLGFVRLEILPGSQSYRVSKWGEVEQFQQLLKTKLAMSLRPIVEQTNNENVVALMTLIILVTTFPLNTLFFSAFFCNGSLLRIKYSLKWKLSKFGIFTPFD